MVVSSRPQSQSLDDYTLVKSELLFANTGAEWVAIYSPLLPRKSFSRRGS